MRPDSWVICINGAATETAVRAAVADLHGVDIKVITAPPDCTTIGALKRHTFMACSGDILLEADHDDLLAPACIAEVKQAFAAGCQFAYSNTAIVVDNDWAARGGWDHYVPVRPCRIYGRDLEEGVCTLTPHALYAGSNAPLHVRAWARDLYHQLGGHDPLVSRSEDFEFLCRVYMACPPDKIAHIDKPLYVWFASNGGVDTCVALGKELHYWVPKHIQGMALRWAANNGLGVIIGASNLVRAHKGKRKHGSAGLVVIGGEGGWYPQADIIAKAWDCLADNGFLLVDCPSATWGPQAFLRVFRPTWGAPDSVVRYQEFWAVHYDAAAGTGVKAFAIADHGGPKAGINHWQPYFADCAANRKLVAGCLANSGVSVRYGGGRVYISGVGAKPAVALLNGMRPGCFVSESEVGVYTG